MEVFYLFKTIMQKGQKDKSKSTSEQEEEWKLMFLKALQEIKYMGYASQTKQSTFIFKKNYFGKTKHSRVPFKTEEQMNTEMKDIHRQFGNN